MEFGSSKAFLGEKKSKRARKKEKSEPEPMSDIKSDTKLLSVIPEKMAQIENEEDKNADSSSSDVADEELDNFVFGASNKDNDEYMEPLPSVPSICHKKFAMPTMSARGGRGGRGGRGSGSSGGRGGYGGAAPALNKLIPAMAPMAPMGIPQMAQPMQPIPLSEVRGHKGIKHKRKVDTNVISLNLKVLKDKGAIATGDPIICTKCKAMFNLHSKLTTTPDGKQIWTCEFCGNSNEVSIDKEEMPQSDELTYVVKSAPQVLKSKEEAKLLAEDISIIFCIDVSGSMCVTQPVHGKVAVKYDKTKNLKDLMKFGDGSLQYTSGEAKNLTYISRMQCLQTAIEKQIIDLCNGAPNRKVGIVTFNNDVTLIGDGTKLPKIITGDKLFNYEDLLKEGMNADEYISKNVKETKKSLVDRLGQIEETGQTALGPALVVSLGLAMKGKPGSKVILCTDGLANIGLGSVEGLTTEALFNESKELYTKVGELAKSKGISISLISLVSEECKLEMLSPLADLTTGDILKVDPMNLSKDFANILSESIIATNVDVRVKLHKGLTFRNENPLNLSEDNSLLIRHIGNATESQEITFEYELKPLEEREKMKDIDFTKLTELPFQSQISYTTLDGMSCVRLTTKTQKTTFDKNEAKKAANYQVLTVNAVQQSAKLADIGEMREAQANAYQWGNMLKGSEGYAEYMNNVAPLYQALQKQQVADFLEEKDMEEKGPSKSSKVKKSKKDEVVVHLNRARQMNKKKLG